MQFLRRFKRCESGFTVIELLVVMLILGILAAIIIPAFSDHTKVVTAEVCHVSQKEVGLPKEAGGTFTLTTKPRPVTHGTYRFKLDTSEHTITSVEEPKPEEEVIRCP